MSIPGAWTVRLHRGDPAADRAAKLATSQGAAVSWCGPGCGCQDQTDEESA